MTSEHVGSTGRDQSADERGDAPEGGEPAGPVIRDKRRFDPQTGELRQPSATPGAAGAGSADSNNPSAGSDLSDVDADADADAEVALAERTADLQRLQAEYLNYKRRVDRDREVARDAGKMSVLTALLPVLDDIGRAREHDELTGGFKAVAESFERAVVTMGLTPFGEVGDEFDPHRHEALMHTYSDEVVGPTCQAILQVGYAFGDRVVRPARVAVAEPAEAVAETEAAAVDDEAAADFGATDEPGQADKAASPDQAVLADQAAPPEEAAQDGTPSEPAGRGALPAYE